MTLGEIYNIFICTVSYDDGFFYSKIKRGRGRRVLNVGDKIKGTVDSDGYLIVTFMKKPLKYHRAVFLYFNGYLPKNVDHINGARSDNKIENLRAATSQQNNMNRFASKNKRCKFKGVLRYKKTNKFAAVIKMNKKSIRLGVFNTEHDAHLAYEKKAKELFGEFYKNNSQNND